MLVQKKIEEIKSRLKTAEYLFLGIIVFITIAVTIMMMVYIPAASGLITSYAETTVQNASLGSGNLVETYFKGRTSYLKTMEAKFQDVDTNDHDAVYEICKEIADNCDFKHVGFTNTDGITVSSTGGIQK